MWFQRLLLDILVSFCVPRLSKLLKFSHYSYTTALQTVALFGLDLKRFPALLGAIIFIVLSGFLIIPEKVKYVSLINCDLVGQSEDRTRIAGCEVRPLAPIVYPMLMIWQTPSILVSFRYFSCTCITSERWSVPRYLASFFKIHLTRT